jgi:hypothetical protein
MKRAIVSVAFGAVAKGRQCRFIPSFQANAAGADIFNFQELPKDSPSHEKVPYAFKAYAIKEVIDQGYDSVLWVDSSIIANRPLTPLWDFIDQQGYWLVDDPDGKGGIWNCGQWTCDSALGPLGITREEAFGIPQIASFSFGLNLNNNIARKFFSEFWQYARQGDAFCGPRTTHRHDQTVASVIAWRLNMKLSPLTDWVHVYRYDSKDKGSNLLTVWW